MTPEALAWKQRKAAKAMEGCMTALVLLWSNGKPRLVGLVDGNDLSYIASLRQLGFGIVRVA